MMKIGDSEKRRGDLSKKSKKRKRN